MTPADYHPLTFNHRVDSMSFAADVDHAGMGEILIPAMAAADADGILTTTSIAAAGTAVAADYAATYSPEKMGQYGRNVSVTCDGAATSTVIITGKDFLGQLTVETITLAGAATIQGKKAFKAITSIAYAVTAARSITVGWGNVLGLPYKINSILVEKVDNAVPGNAGAVVVGYNTATQTAITADVRGTYAPHTSFIPDGSRVHKITGSFDRTNLHGYAQFAG